MTNANDPTSPTGQNQSGTGLTKREYFAAMAMQGLCANYLRENVTGWGIGDYAIEAVELADSLIMALNLTPCK